MYFLWESGHLFLFFLGCSLFYTFYPRFSNFTFVRQSAIILGATLFAIVVLEGVHSFVSGKSLSGADVIGDIAGTLLFLSLRSKRNGGKHFLLYAMALLLTGFVLWPALSSFSDEMLARYQFPLLADFETPFEASRFEGKTGDGVLSKEQAFHGKGSLRLSLSPGPWSGVMLKHFPSNWQGFAQLNFAVYNPSRQLVSLHVRIHDILHEQGGMLHTDRYNRIVSLPAGWTKVRISLAEVQTAPQARSMDLAQISGLGFFVVREENPLVLYLDTVRLE